MDMKQSLASLIAETIENCYAGVEGLPTCEDIQGFLEIPPQKEMGDYAFPCFKLSRALHMAPPQIAATLAGAVSAPDLCEAKQQGGYLNFFLHRDNFAQKTLESVLAAGERYGSGTEGNGKTICLDFSSINIAKRFHIGHLSTTMLGQSLRRIYDFLGYKTIAINYLGDWGTQFGKMLCAYKKWGNKEDVEKEGVDALTKLYVRFHEEAEKDPSLEDEGRAWFKKIEDGDEEALRLFNWFKELTLRDTQRVYDLLGVTFDSYNGEAFFNDKMGRVIDELKAKNLLTISDGASIVDLDEDKTGMPPCLILKKDGATLYATRDIAAAVYRKQEYHFDKCIYVTSAQQILHFRQWFKVVELMGYDWYDELVHVPYGTVSVNGAKLATRTGNVVLLRDLFGAAIEKVTEIMETKNPALKGRTDVAEAVGVGAIVFYYLSNNRIKDINFSMEEALSFDGNTGPYVQYTYARACSILEKAGVTDGTPAPAELTLTDPLEKVLCVTLSEFEERVRMALRDYEPSYITRYILDVATAFNRFYHDCAIVTAEDAAVRETRLALTRATKYVLGRAFGLICLRKTEKI